MIATDLRGRAKLPRILQTGKSWVDWDSRFGITIQGVHSSGGEVMIALAIYPNPSYEILMIPNLHAQIYQLLIAIYVVAAS